VVDAGWEVGFRVLTLDADSNAEAFYEAMGAVPVVGVVPSGSIPERTLNRYAFEL
jgi:hypothetical protein